MTTALARGRKLARMWPIQYGAQQQSKDGLIMVATFLYLDRLTAVGYALARCPCNSSRSLPCGRPADAKKGGGDTIYKKPSL